MPNIQYSHPETGEIVARGKRFNRRQLVPVVEFPKGLTIDTIEGAVPGAAGQVRASCKKAGTRRWHSSPWRDVDPDRDFTLQFHVTGLQPATRYVMKIESRTDETSVRGETIEGFLVKRDGLFFEICPIIGGAQRGAADKA